MTNTDPIREATTICRPYFFKVGLFSVIVNLLTFAGSIYMLQVYDRVLASRSVETLVVLTLLILLMFAFQGILEVVRSRMLGRMGALFEMHMIKSVYRAVRALASSGTAPENTYQPVRDLDAVRNFMCSLGPTTLFDMPFAPVFLAFCFFLHPWVGVLALGGGLVIVALAVLAELRSRKFAGELNASQLQRQVFIEGLRRNVEIINSMGMQETFQNKFGAVSKKFSETNLSSGEAIATIGVVAKIFRTALQSLVLGLGAYLVIKGEMSGGAMIACSIMSARALAPVEVAVANWRSFLGARNGLTRLNALFAKVLTPEIPRTELALPSKELAVGNISVQPPHSALPVIKNVSFRLAAGQCLGIIGPSASGKSSLARGILGLWPLQEGEVRLDGVSITHWDNRRLGAAIGYLPQDVELFDGTIAENIARFDPERTDARVVAAAVAAGAHEMIVNLPNAYETALGESGSRLSGGQRQRIGLARALYGDPFLVVLDEPNSSLDANGERALQNAIAGVRKRGGIVIIITHRRSAMAHVDLLGVLMNGTWEMFGPTMEVLEKLQGDTEKRKALRPSTP